MRCRVADESVVVLNSRPVMAGNRPEDKTGMTSCLVAMGFGKCQKRPDLRRDEDRLKIAKFSVKLTLLTATSGAEMLRGRLNRWRRASRFRPPSEGSISVETVDCLCARDAVETVLKKPCEVGGTVKRSKAKSGS